MHSNSILLDGVIIGKPEYSESEKRCAFQIKSARFYRAGNKTEKKENTFPVVATGKAAKFCSTKTKGLVRIVGTLETDENNAVFVETDRVEFISNN